MRSRVLLWVVLAAAALWSGYWVVGWRALDGGARAWFDAQAAEGREATYDGLRVSGYPNRFDLTIDGLHLADSAQGTVFDAPQVRVYSLSYKPWHIIAALASGQTVTLPDQTVTVTSDQLESSVIMVPGADLALDRVSAIGRAVKATSSQGWSIGAAEARLATRRVADDPLTHEIGLEVTGLAPDPVVMARMAGPGGLPATLETIHLDAFVTFTAPLDRHAGETRPQVARIDLRETTVTWGTLSLRAEGQIVPDADGLAEGRITFDLTNWRAVPPALAAAGLITEQVRPTVENAMMALAAQSPDPDVLSLPLVFANGRMSLGPLPLGPAPSLRQP